MKEHKFTHHAISNISDTYSLSLLQMGYGLRVIDGVSIVQINEMDEQYRLLKATEQDIDILYPMYEEHCKHLANSPIFLDITYSKSQLEKALHSKNMIYKFYFKEELIGYTTINLEQPCGCDLFFDNDSMSIKGTHISHPFQGKGHGRKLIENLHQLAREYHKAKLVTDFEIFNENALRFWPKHFRLVGHSYVRYIG